MHATFYFGNPKGRYHMGELGVNGRVGYKWILGECGMRTWSRLLALDGVGQLALLNRQWTLGFGERQGFFFNI
jgi:hypothetical protein